MKRFARALYKPHIRKFGDWYECCLEQRVRGRANAVCAMGDTPVNAYANLMAYVRKGQIHE